MPLRFDERAYGLDRPRHHHRGVQASFLQVDLTGRDPRDIEQVVDESHKVMELTFGDVICGLAVMVGQSRQTEESECVAESRERIPELVREHGEELVLASVGFAQ